MMIPSNKTTSDITRFGRRTLACAVGLALSLGHSATSFAATDPLTPEGPQPAPAAEQPSEVPAPTVTKSSEPTPAVDASSARPSAEERAQRRRIIVGSTLTSVGLAMSVGAGIMGHFALNPPCTDTNDPTTCSFGMAEVKSRAGLLGASMAFSLGGAVMSGLGGRQLGKSAAWKGGTLAGDQRSDVPRTTATATGAVGIALGGAGLIAGSVLIGIGAGKAAQIPEIDANSDPAMVAADFENQMKGVRMVRSGYAALVVAPGLLAAGVGLLKHARRRSSATAWNLTPQVGAGYAGMQTAFRF